MTPINASVVPQHASHLLRDFKASPAAYLAAARAIDAANFVDLKPVRISVASTFTADMLKPYLAVESALRGLQVTIAIAPFNQLEAQILDASSALYQFRPDVVLLALRLEDANPDLMDRFLSFSEAELLVETSRQILSRMQNLIDALRVHSSASLFVFNFAPPKALAAGLADSSLIHGQTQFVSNLNQELIHVVRNSPSTFLFDLNRLITECGVAQEDTKLWYMARVPFSAPTQIAISKRLARYLRALYFPPCKCLVLDLDNTLWGGVLGEDGIGGIKLGEEYPGRVFKDFQRAVLALRDRGIMLAIASKNNRAEVEEIFAQHEDMVLKLEDFSALQIHWEEKAASLRAIARELNIGTDALAFFDDSPVERDWIRSQMPEVTVIEVPASGLEFARTLETCGAFDALALSDEDRKRANLYQSEKKREAVQARSPSLDDFLKTLEMKITYGHLGPETLSRVAQLIAKTNQFNMTTRRYSETELLSMIASGSLAFWFRVADRFGDAGLVGAAILKRADSETWHVDTLLLSCRVLGRKVEAVILKILLEEVRAKGARKLAGEFIPTAKNRPAADFYRDQGFTQENAQLWIRDISQSGIEIPESIQVDKQSDTGN